MEYKELSELEMRKGWLSLCENNDNPPYKNPEPPECQALRIARAAEDIDCSSVMSEMICNREGQMETLLDDPDKLLRSILTDQILEYRAFSAGLSMAILTSKKGNATAEELMPLKLKIDDHVLKTAKLAKQLSDPIGQIQISGKQVNVGINQKIENSGQPTLNNNEKSVDISADENVQKITDSPKIF